MLTVHPTQHNDVNEILILLLASVKETLKGQFVGLYLYGSLSSGDFDLDSSDIDFLVVIEDILPESAVLALEDMHNRIWKTGWKWAAKLEGSYVHRELIRRHDPNGAPCPTVNEGKFYLDKRGSDWIIQRHVIREYGVIIEGPNPKTLIDFVGPDDIHTAVMGTLREWRFPMLDNPIWLKERGSEYYVYAIVSMCSALHALEHGTIVSKPKAIQWARSQLNERWAQIIDKAVDSSQIEKDDALLNEALAFIQFTMEQVSKSKHIKRVTL